MEMIENFSVRVIAAECHSQMLFATFFSTWDFCGRRFERNYFCKISMTKQIWKIYCEEKGRRIFVRWDFNIGPEDRDLVVALPPETRLTSGERRPTIAKISLQKLGNLQTAMNDSANWVGLASEFSYEKSLSDYISAYPYRLEDGLLPHPNKKVRERVFSDSKRLDILLEDKFGQAVIVECKQNQPTVQDVQQLQHYLNKFKDEEGQEARGILIHGGARKLREEVRQAAKKKPTVELVQFNVGVDFSKSE
ncbi:MAG TPA: endonuclease NucS domain-containing protein [Methylomirabilota bacterium]|nr:endonuclease NucS domain-containing protein [Methylomirabilota bacterium]